MKKLTGWHVREHERWAARRLPQPTPQAAVAAARLTPAKLVEVRTAVGQVPTGWHPGNPDYDAVRAHILSMHGNVQTATGRIAL